MRVIIVFLVQIGLLVGKGLYGVFGTAYIRFVYNLIKIFL